MGSFPQLEEYGDSLLRGHLNAAEGIGEIGFLKGVEDADYFLHSSILPCFALVACFGGGGFPP